MKSMKMLVLYKRDFYSRRSVWRAQPHHIAYKSFQQLDWASPSAQSQGEDSHCWSVQPCLPQCLEEKTMNKMQSRVQSGLLSLGTQNLIEEDARQGTALLWQCTEELPSLLGSREVLSLQEWLTPYTHEKSTRTVLEYK